MSKQKSPPRDRGHAGKPAGDELARGILRAAATVRRALDRALAGSGLTSAQFEVLRIVRRAGDAGVATLAVRAQLAHDAPGITRLLEVLARAGFVRRARTNVDRRQVICRITPAGQSLVDVAELRVSSALDQLGRRLSASERAACLRSLDALSERSPAGR
jgi:DNA-binding MarR family transcriptional regulator